MNIQEYKIKQQNDFFRHYINDPNRDNDWKQPRFKKMLELINGLKDKDIKIADIGCGLGDFLYLLKRNGYKNIKGFDVCEAAVDFTRKRGLNADLTKEYLDTIADKFSLIVCGDILEHVLAPEHFLDKIRGLLNPGGKLLLTVPNFGCLYNNCLVSLLPDEISKTVSFATRSHINHFVGYTLDDLLKKEGFSVIQKTGVKLDTRIYPGSKRTPIKYLLRMFFNLLVYVNNMFASFNVDIFSPHLIIIAELVDKPKTYKSGYWDLYT